MSENNIRNFSHPSLKNAPSQNKDRFEEAIDKMIDLCSQSEIDNKTDSTADKFTPVNIRRAKLKNDMLQEATFPELEKYLELANDTLINNAKRYLQPEEYVAFSVNFAQVAERLETIDITVQMEQSFCDLLHVTPATMEALLSIGTATFDEGQYDNALSLFVLLTVLDPEQSDYWFRLGIAAQYKQDLELALKAYAITLFLDPDALGARLFACRCYLQMNALNEAANELAEAKKIVDSGTEKFETNWLDLLSNLEKMLQFDEAESVKEDLDKTDNT